MTPLQAISPIDGRYASKTRALSDYFSEYALIRYRVLVEVKYLRALHALGLPQLQTVGTEELTKLDRIVDEFTLEDAEEIKRTERITNHDVKAVEYFVKQRMEDTGLGAILEFTHFGLTSQDINNTAVPLSLKEGLREVIYPAFERLLTQVDGLVEEWREIPLLAKTHDSPPPLLCSVRNLPCGPPGCGSNCGSCGKYRCRRNSAGATGNMNAHYVSYPDYDWHAFATTFVEDDLGLRRSYPTTQIEHYDNLAALFHGLSRCCTILIDLCRDAWTYISMEYFRQRTTAGEIGSSAMPHKVNPIDFENAEGNLGIARALFGHLADKLPVSRLQRDLTDSTVLRNIGVPLAHLQIALLATEKGLSKLLINPDKIAADLEANWMVTAEAIQNILRREGYPEPYEALKALTRGRTNIDEGAMRAFIDDLAVGEAVKGELRAIRPENYVGKF